jgi:phosphoglucosamine mutase
MEKMRDTGAVLGGENSGHLIFLDHHTTGDGILSALRLAEVLQDEKKPLSELKSAMTVYPQELLAVDVRQKPDLKGLAGVQDAIKEVREELGAQGRVLVRYSGTQPVCRIMVEGPDASRTLVLCRRIADAVQRAIGVDA